MRSQIDSVICVCMMVPLVPAVAGVVLGWLVVVAAVEVLSLTPVVSVEGFMVTVVASDSCVFLVTLAFGVVRLVAVGLVVTSVPFRFSFEQTV